MAKLQYYTYNADGQRTRRKIDGVETWQIYGFDGELLAEYAANASAASPQEEYGFRNGQLLVTAETPARTNYALAANGGTASASSYLGPPYNYYASFVNNGARTSANNAIWLDNTINSFPDWVQVDFNGSKTISQIDVITQQDNQNPTEPTLAQTFSLYGITAFDVQYWNGSSWVTVPGGSVIGNNKVWRQFTFSPITTGKIRVVINAGADNVYSRVVEVEAWSATEATQSFVTSKTLGAQRADSPGWTGFKMTTGGQPVTVTTLGRLCVAAGNTGTHELRLIRVSDNSVVASVNVSMSGCTVGQFKYAALANPITLSASTAYLLVGYEVGTDTFHDWTGTVLTTTSVATVNHGVYTTNGGQTWGEIGDLQAATRSICCCSTCRSSTTTAIGAGVCAWREQHLFACQSIHIGRFSRSELTPFIIGP